MSCVICRSISRAELIPWLQEYNQALTSILGLWPALNLRSTQRCAPFDAWLSLQAESLAEFVDLVLHRAGIGGVASKHFHGNRAPFGIGDRAAMTDGRKLHSVKMLLSRQQ